MDSPTPVHRTYTEEEQAKIVATVAASAGKVRPAAARLGVPHMTVVGQWNKWMEEAHDLTDRTKDVTTLANRFLAVAIAAQHKLMELIPAETSAYRAALISGINLDKYLLLTGRPTSRTEVLKARYVEPGALRTLSARVITVEGRTVEGEGGSAIPAGMPPQRGRGVRGGAPPSQVERQQKSPISHLRSPQKPRSPRRPRPVLKEPSSPPDPPSPLEDARG